MPFIPQFLLDSVAYLYASEEDAKRGEPMGGSGFLVGVTEHPNPRDGTWDYQTFHDMEQRLRWPMAQRELSMLYVVTAAHVVDSGARTVRLTTATFPPVGSGSSRNWRFMSGQLQEMAPVNTVILPLDAWQSHPAGDDVAVCPIGLSSEYPELAWVPEPYCLATRESEYHAAPGDEVFMLGRFATHEGQQHNAPTVRFGNIAMRAEETVTNPATGHEQESYLVELHSLPGFSGSPVFVYEPRVSFDMRDLEHRQKDAVKFEPIGAFSLLGIDWCHLPFLAEMVDQEGRRIGTLWVKGNAGMAGVVPAWKLTELLLEHEELVEMRKKRIPEVGK